MLVYRALLIDTEQSYKRPVQQYFSDLQVAEDWATKTLAVAGDNAYVQLYRAFEKECGRVLKPLPEVPDDKSTAPRLQSLAQKAGQ